MGAVSLYVFKAMDQMSVECNRETLKLRPKTTNI